MRLTIILGVVLVISLCLHVDAAAIHEDVEGASGLNSKIRKRRDDATCPINTGDGVRTITTAQCLAICKQNGYDIGGCLDGFCECAYRHRG